VGTNSGRASVPSFFWFPRAGVGTNSGRASVPSFHIPPIFHRFPTQIASGLGQCMAEMYATLKKFEQNKVYGIITDGEVWKFLFLENSVLTIDKKGYYISNVSGIVDRVGYIAESVCSTLA